jgi:serine/threonine-protein kinase
MRAIRRDPAKRYLTMEDMVHDLCHLHEVTPLDYVPDPPQTGGRYRYVIRIGLVVLGVILLIIAFGLLAQLAHHTTR